MSSQEIVSKVSGKTASSDSNTQLGDTRTKNSSKHSKTNQLVGNKNSSQMTSDGSVTPSENHKKIKKKSHTSLSSPTNPFAALSKQAINYDVPLNCSVTEAHRNRVPVIKLDGCVDWVCGRAFAWYTGNKEIKCSHGKKCKHTHISACKNFLKGTCKFKNCKFEHVRLWDVSFCRKNNKQPRSMCKHWKTHGKCRQARSGQCSFAHSLDELTMEPHAVFMKDVLDNPTKYPDLFEDIRNELVRVIYQDDVLTFIQAEYEKNGSEFTLPNVNNIKRLLYTWKRFFRVFRTDSTPGPKMALFDGPSCLMENVVQMLAINSQRQCNNENCMWHHNCRRGYHLEPDKILQPFWFDFTYLLGGESNKQMIAEFKELKELGIGDTHFLPEDFSDGWKPLKKYEGELVEKINSIKKSSPKECRYGVNCRNYHKCSFTHGIRDEPDSWSTNISDYDGRRVFFSQGITDRRDYDYKIVKSAGILFYSMVDKEKKFLFTCQQNGKRDFSYADLGGKSEHEDSTPIDTAIRETVEETNGHLFSGNDSYEECDKKIKELFVNPPSRYYDSRGKYMVYFIEMDDSFFNLSLDRFEKNNRMHWLGIDEIHYDEVHPRLVNYFYN